MEKIILHLDQESNGHFQVMRDDHPVAEMAVSVSDQILTVIHTNVLPEMEGQGLGKKLLAHMVEYARENQLKVLPLCPFVHGQFKKQPGEYKDIWYKTVVH